MTTDPIAAARALIAANSLPAGNVGHGHVFPRPDGVRARCGGTKMCKECAADLARKLDPWSALATLADALEAERAENQRLREALLSTAASLAAAISLLERGGKAVKKEAPSDKMFDQMLADYRKSLGVARAALRSTEASHDD